MNTSKDKRLKFDSRGIFHGVLSDGILNDESSRHEAGSTSTTTSRPFLFDGISLVEDVLEDGVITEDERKS